MQNTEMGLMGEALARHREGWALVPLHPQGKHPITHSDGIPMAPRGVRDWSRDPEQIVRWWSIAPWANIGGVPAASEPARVSLDFDVCDGLHEGLRGLEKEIGQLPDTHITYTGGGGLHYHYAARRGFHVPSWVLCPGVEIMAERHGQRGVPAKIVVLPGSLHRSGKKYEWDIAFHPDDCPLAPLPMSFVKMILTHFKSPVSAQGMPPEHWLECGTPIEQGSRNYSLFIMGSGWRGRGMQSDEISSHLLHINSELCSPPLGEREVRGIARSIAGFQKGHRGKLINPRIGGRAG